MLLVTNDSQVFRMGEGKGRRATDLLEEVVGPGLPTPADDLDDERWYRNRFQGLLGPAGDRLGGRFTEVRNLHDRLSAEHEASLKVISGRYGLIDASDPIVPYHHPVGSKREIDELERRTGFVEDLVRVMKEYECVVFLLPKAFVGVLKERGVFVTDGTVIAVTSRDFKECLDRRPNCLFMERRGARVGRENAGLIRSTLKRLRL